jgi:predicted ATPase/DNA-binding SARP family transcriptional activator
MLELLLFGTVEVKVGGVSLHSLSAKGRLLLAYLALNSGRAVATGAIADAIFPGSQAEDPHDLIKKAASELRRLLGTEGYRLSSPAPRRLALDLDGAEVDWLAFKSAIKSGDAESLQHAITLHAQPLLDMEPYYWALQEQEICLRLRQQALETLYEGAMKRADLESAGSRLLQMLQFELPEVTIREELWRQWIEALLLKQEYGKIQLHYGRLQAFLANTAGRAPEAATQALYNRIPKSILLQLALAGHKKKRGGLPASARMPHFPYALIGRDAEKRELIGAFKNSRLVTVVGIGGVGKTRFAAQVGNEIGADYKDEVGFIDLTSCPPNGVLQSIANVLGVKEGGSSPLYQSLQEFLAPRRILLIIDNCEHHVDEVADLVSRLIRDCAHLRLLLTSRQMLRIDGEQIFALQPLALPQAGRGRAIGSDELPTLPLIRESPAVRLFVERATAVSHAFRLTAENSKLIVDLCRLVDGLPLGIEMVASQTAGVPLERIVQDLSQSVLKLKHSHRSVLPRHQTLHATLDWSYGTLNAAERILLRRLSVFSGGWTLEAAEQVCSDETLPLEEIASLLSELVTKSVVVMELSDQRSLPYRFLETIRTYAAELLEEHNEVQRFQAAHGQYYLQMLSALDHLSKIKEYLVAGDRNRANLYIAMQRSLEEPDRMPTGQRIGMALHTYWSHRALSSEGRDWHRSFLNAGKDHLPTTVLATSMLEIAEFSAGLGQGGSEEAQECQRQAAEIFRAAGDLKGESDVCFSVGMRQAYLGQLDEAYVNFRKVYDYYRQTDHPHMTAFMLILMSGCLLDVSYDRTCETMYLEALEIARTKQLPSIEGLAHMSIGERAHRASQLELAERHFTLSMAAYRSIDSPWGAVKAGFQLAEVKRQQGDFDSARRLLHECLIRSCEFSNRRETLFVLSYCARLLHSCKDWEASLSLSASLLNLSDRYPDELKAHRDECQKAIDEASAHLVPKETEAMLLGAKMADFDTLLDYTLALLQESKP